jgi:spermidine synthase
MLSPTHGLRLPPNGQRGTWRITREPRSLKNLQYECIFLRQKACARRWTAWMSDHPVELSWTKRLADRTVGDRILIGGLGLGLLPQLLLPRAGRSVLILENAPEVIDLVLDGWDMPDGLAVQQADVWEFLRYAPSLPRFDTIIMDIWHTVDDAERREIMRLQQLAAPWLQPEGRYVAWGDNWLGF